MQSCTYLNTVINIKYLDFDEIEYLFKYLKNVMINFIDTSSEISC